MPRAKAFVRAATKEIHPPGPFRSVAFFVEALTRVRDQNQTYCTLWAGKFINDPQYEMEWAGATFRSAAKVRAYDEVLYQMEHGVSAIAIRKRITDDVLHAARYPYRSTEPSANLAREELLAAKAAILDDWPDFGVEVIPDAIL